MLAYRPAITVLFFTAADKLLLVSNMKQRAIELREKELHLFNENFNAVGTQAAVLAGFAMTAFAELNVPADSPIMLKTVYYLCTVVSLCAELNVVAHTTFVNVFGCSLALRGPDGSMQYAVDGMLMERQRIFACFGIGLLSLQATAICASWLLMEDAAAVVASCVILYSTYFIVEGGKRIYTKFKVDDSDVANFDDLINSVTRRAAARDSSSHSPRSGHDSRLHPRDRVQNRGNGEVEYRTEETWGSQMV